MSRLKRSSASPRHSIKDVPSAKNGSRYLQRSVRYRRDVFHTEAITNNPTALYVIALEFHANLPTRTPNAEIHPMSKGPYPALALNASAVKVRTKKATVSGNKYTVEIRKLSPSEVSKAA